MLPVTAVALLESIELLAAAAANLSERTIGGLEATDRGPALVEQGLMLATALAPVIGYDEAAKLAKEAFRSGRTIRELALERGMSPDDLDRLLDPAAMTGRGWAAGSAGAADAGASARTRWAWGRRWRSPRRDGVRASGRNAGRRIARRVGHEAPQSDAGPRRARDEPGPPGAGRASPPRPPRPLIRGSPGPCAGPPGRAPSVATAASELAAPVIAVGRRGTRRAARPSTRCPRPRSRAARSSSVASRAPMFAGRSRWRRR